MGKEDNIIPQSLIDDSIAILERSLVYYILSAAIQDGLGDWNKASCLLHDAKGVMLEIGILESACPDAIKFTVPGAGTCLVTSIGIGLWAVGSAISGSEKGCNVFEIKKSALPPPYGVFTNSEFTTIEFTQQIT